MDYSLSSKDIKDFLGGKIRIIVYRELSKFQDIDQLLDPYDGCIILYETEYSYGHWVLLMRTRWGIEFFDSYGVKIDDQIKNIRENYRDIKGQLFPHLTMMILNSGRYNIISNAVQLQKKSANIQTCGRWCIFRYLNRHSDLKSFIKLFEGYKLGDKDKLIARLIQLNNELVINF
jgi:hypothetical protein